MFKNISIKARLIFVLGLLAVLLMINGGFGLYGLNKTNASLQKVYEQDAANVIRLSAIERKILKNRIALFIATAVFAACFSCHCPCPYFFAGSIGRLS